MADHGLMQGTGLVRGRTAPDRLVSTPGTLPTTAGDWSTACQSMQALLACPRDDDAGREEGLVTFRFFNSCE